MKRTVKITLMLLVLALMVSCFAITSVATDEAAPDAAELLEYYNGVSFSETYEESSLGAYAHGALDVPANHSETIDVVEIDGERALKLYAAIRTDAIDTYYVANVDSEATGFGFSFSVKLNATDLKHPTHARGKFAVTAMVYEAVDGNQSTELFGMTTAKTEEPGYLKVATATGDKTINEVPILNNVRYEVSYFLNFKTGKFTFSVKWNDGTAKTYTSEELDSGFESLTRVSMGFGKNSITGSTNYIYGIRAYNGSFNQAIQSDEVTSVVDAKIAEIIAAYDNGAYSEEEVISMSAVLAELKTLYGFTSPDSARDARVVEISSVGKVLYAERFMEGIADINKNKPYANRVSYIGRLEKYYNFVSNLGNIDGVDMAKLTAAKASYVEELEELEATAADSVAVISVVSGYTLENVGNATYADLIGIYEQVKLLKHIDSTYSKETAPAATIATTIVVKVETTKEKGDALIEAAEVLGSSATIKFGPLYAAYIKAKTNSNVDLTYPGATAARNVYVAFAASNSVEMEAKAAECDSLIETVAGAKNGRNYTARRELLASVATLVGKLDPTELDYPGLAAAISDYNAVTLELDAQMAAATQYIAAVNAIKNASSFADIKAAVVAAQALKEAGAISGIEGVEAATSYLAERETYVICVEGYSKMFIDTVAEIKNETDAAAKFNLIVEATAMKAQGYDEYQGFSAAVAEFETIKTEFINKVNAVSDAFADLMKTAADAVASPASQKLVKVSEIVKKIFE